MITRPAAVSIEKEFLFWRGLQELCDYKRQGNNSLEIVTGLRRHCDISQARADAQLVCLEDDSILRRFILLTRVDKGMPKSLAAALLFPRVSRRTADM